MLALQYESDDPITIFINSQGGHVESGDTIYDMIKFVKPEVKIVGTGWVASAGALIYAAVKRENRFSLPNTRFLLHQPSGGAGGSASEIEIHAREIIRMRKRLNEIFARETGQTYERIARTPSAITGCRPRTPRLMAWWVESSRTPATWLDGFAAIEEAPLRAGVWRAVVTI